MPGTFFKSSMDLNGPFFVRYAMMAAASRALKGQAGLQFDSPRFIHINPRDCSGGKMGGEIVDDGFDFGIGRLRARSDHLRDGGLPSRAILRAGNGLRQIMTLAADLLGLGFPRAIGQLGRSDAASIAKTMSVLVFDRKTESIESPITSPQINLTTATGKAAVANRGCHDIAAVPQLLTGDGIERTQDRGGRV